MGVPKRRRVEVSGVNICRIEGGKAAEEWEQYDAMGMMQQFGAVPEPGQAAGV